MGAWGWGGGGVHPLVVSSRWIWPVVHVDEYIIVIVIVIEIVS
jgi:hypothetical protein